MSIRTFPSPPRIGAAALVAVSLLAAPAAGQEAGMGSDAEMTIMQSYLINAFERAKAWDMSLAQAMPDSALRWAPSDDVRDYAEQIVHAANNLFIAQSVFGMEAPDIGDPEVLMNDKAALAGAVGTAYDWIVQQLQAMPAADLAAEAPFFGGRMMPKWRICLFALEHAMWTRGQLVPYLRAHGVTPPPQQLF